MVLPVEKKKRGGESKPRQSSVRDSQLWGPIGLGDAGRTGGPGLAAPKGPRVSI